MRSRCRNVFFLICVVGGFKVEAFISQNFEKQKPGSNLLKINQQLNDDQVSCEYESTRRSIISSMIFATTSLVASQPSFAGEVGAKITKAVTTSDLGISVRRSVVKGAQIIDSLDGKWEKFSDDNGLGAARFNQEGRPKPRVVPELRPLNIGMAKNILKLSDDSFIEITKISQSDLDSQLERVESTVRKSYERSGIDLSREMTSKEFDYYCYIHFKAYCDLIVGRKLSFNRKSFENALGDKLLGVFFPSFDRKLAELNSKQQGLKPNSKDCLMNGIDLALSVTDDIMKNLVENGFVAQAERNEVDSDRLKDWIDDLADIQLSIPLDGDITLSSQVLLQEQGFRVYPDFSRFVINSAIEKSLAATNQRVSSDEYYMDTNYSSDPDLFEVKQVLLNIVIDST